MGNILLLKEIILLLIGFSLLFEINNIFSIVLCSTYIVISFLENRHNTRYKCTTDIILGILLAAAIHFNDQSFILFIAWLIIKASYTLVEFVTSKEMLSLFRIVIGIISIILSIILIVKPFGSSELFSSLIAFYFILGSIIEISIWRKEKMRYI